MRGTTFLCGSCGLAVLDMVAGDDALVRQIGFVVDAPIAMPSNPMTAISSGTLISRSFNPRNVPKATVSVMQNNASHCRIRVS